MMKNTNKGKEMKTTNMMLLGVVTTLALATGAYATCATNIDMGNNKIVNVADPTDNKDVVNKQYLEAYMQDYMYETMKNRFIRDNTKEVVLDVSTNLMWQDNAVAASTRKQWVVTISYILGDYLNTSGDTATTYCTNISLGGYTDWRLPDRDELLGIVKSTANAPSISNIFQYTASSYYWSSTTVVDNEGNAWYGSFLNDSDYWFAKNNSLYVRCVRDGQ